MKKLAIWLLAISFLGLGLAAMEDGPAAPKKGGYALIDMYIRSFQAMAAQGTTVEGFESSLQAVASEAKKAKDAGEVDQVFHCRFARVLALTKLIIKPDPASILMPVIDREIADFLKDVMGEDVAARTGPVAVGQVANAIAEELINLQIYLDTLDKREAMRKKLDEGMAGLPNKK
jgi:hypothetical protein